MKDKLEQIFDKHHEGYAVYNKDEIIKELLVLFGVSGSASELETDMFKLINSYCKNGLKKPDLVKKMEWVTGSCKMS